MNLLATTLLMPLLGLVLVWVLGASSRSVARLITLATTLVTLVFAARVVCCDPLPEFDVPWLGGAVDVHMSLGLDGLSRWMFGLSALLAVTAVLVSWEAIEDRAPGFYALLLLLEAGMLGVFAARDLILFYVCFEFTLIPLFFLIGIWGSEERRYAAIKFFLYTLAGSLLTFVGLLTIVVWNYLHMETIAGERVLTFSIAALKSGLDAHPLPSGMQLIVFWALFIGFAIKVPLFPLHTWLPLAHVQAPTAGSVLLAGVLLKIGTYGFLRFSIPLLPEATVECMPWILWLSAAGIVYGALVALAQGDIKRLIAYSSVSHLGYCMLGIFALNPLGVQGGVLQMINHGLSTGGLFAVVGMVYERYHTRQIADLGGLARRLPLLTVFMLLFTFSSIGLPGLNGFAGEFLILVGMFQRGAADAPVHLGAQYTAISVLAVFGVVLGAWYMLWLVQRVFFGPLKEPAQHGRHAGAHAHHAATHSATANGHHHDSHASHAHDHGHGHAAPLGPGPADMNLREIAALVPLVVLMFWIGLAPQHFLQPMAGDLNNVTSAAAQRIQASATTTAERAIPALVASPAQVARHSATDSEN